MFRKMKDITLSKGAKMAINKQISEYGEILKLHLDSKLKSIEMEVMLDGEHTALLVQVQNYKMTQEDDKHFIKIYGVSTSRAWINTLASSFLEGKSFEIPEKYAKMIKAMV